MDSADCASGATSATSGAVFGAAIGTATPNAGGGHTYDNQAQGRLVTHSVFSHCSQRVWVYRETNTSATAVVHQLLMRMHATGGM